MEKGNKMKDFADFESGPGTNGGRYLRLFWHPIFRSIDLSPGRAVAIRIMCENFTLYRGEDSEVRVVDAFCPHRGTRLTTGWVEGDGIRCLYHGWKFDGSGQCVERPGEEPELATRIKIRTYPVKEYLGLIFAYFGDGDAPPLPRFPELEGEGVLETDPPEKWPCHFLNRLDNDLAHVPWTHRETMIRIGWTTPDINVGPKQSWHETIYGLGDQTIGRFARVMPNMNALRVPVMGDPRWNGMFQNRLVIIVPDDDDNSTAFDITFVPNLTGQRAEEYLGWRQANYQAFSIDEVERYARAILAGKMTLRDLPKSMSREESFMIEDYVTQVGQGHPRNRPMENLGRNDLTVIQYRRLWSREVAALANGTPVRQWSTERIWAFT
jgi:5,5'-dehydrodivanillate O-demethylase